MPSAPPKGPPPGSIPAKPQSIPPNQTLYVRGLPSAHIKKDDLRTALYMLFSTYGVVLDVVALKTAKMRGQAHIVFRDIQTATQAMRALDGFEFLGQQMKVSYAKSRSNVLTKLDGVFKMPTTTAPSQAAEMTDLKSQIFNAPVPGSSTAAVASAPSGLPSKPSVAPPNAETAESRGQKRPREEEAEEEDEDSDVAMEEDSDDE
ncbi:hypothetical protein BD289DRAFT_365246 [Coniella lustricola]|uniref:RRM domain-containing protein n=1 Tax=Coniella lustricola TaxID=2025994 RepID=A0A2T3ACE4_9PEZI|nr:hypothetical protein BD289DRAFT_365246 [Coniella lustricola]